MKEWKVFVVLMTIQATICSGERIKRQQGTTSSVASFIGQLTSLINANGGLGNIASVLQGGGQQDSGYQGPPYQGLQQGGGHQEYQNPQGYPAGGGGGFGTYPPAPYDPNLYGSRPGLLGALTSIARYDDLKCVPRLLCEVTSGGKPGGYDGKQQSLVPFASKDSLVALLTVLNYVDDSPLLGFGRAALLGYTARGDQRACLNAFPTCPRDADALVDYLNNHNGGFFRFFNTQFGSQYAPYYPHPSHQGNPGAGYTGPDYAGAGYAGAAYPGAGYPGVAYPEVGNAHPYPHSPAYSEYQHYQQRPYRRYKQRPYGDYDGQYSSGYQDYYQQGRIQNKPEFFTNYGGSNGNGNDGSFYLKNDGKTLVFPTDRLSGSSGNRGGKYLNFSLKQHNYEKPFKQEVGMRFPDRTGTGELRLDLDAYGGYKGVHYASTEHRPREYVKFRDQRSIKFPSSDREIRY